VTSRYYLKTRDYLVEKNYRSVAIIGQPELQYYFHRPVSTILNYFFQSGFVLDAYEEPSYKEITNPASLHNNVFQHIPPALVCRLRLKD
jgi:hypothetical protein